MSTDTIPTLETIDQDSFSVQPVAWSGRGIINGNAVAVDIADHGGFYLWLVTVGDGEDWNKTQTGAVLSLEDARFKTQEAVYRMLEVL